MDFTNFENLGRRVAVLYDGLELHVAAPDDPSVAARVVDLCRQYRNVEPAFTMKSDESIKRRHADERHIARHDENVPGVMRKTSASGKDCMTRAQLLSQVNECHFRNGGFHLI